MRAHCTWLQKSLSISKAKKSSKPPEPQARAKRKTEWEAKKAAGAAKRTAEKAKRAQGSNMVTPKKVFKTIDEYIATFPKNVQIILEELRQAIRESAPET